MRIILSRKGFDSQYGRQASPILPDGTLLSFPIPSEDDITYDSILWAGQSYLDIIRCLKPRTFLNENSKCHLDPDLRAITIHRESGWMPAYGQTGSSLSELRTNGVTKGDLFLFFGWFKHTENYQGRLRYIPRTPNLHVIYGYMQIGNIIESIEQIPEWLEYHPHANLQNYKEAWEKGQNAIYLPTDHLTFAPDLQGSGTFKYDKNLVLTKEGYSRSRWEFPKSMRGVAISHNPNGWKSGYFQSAAIGQEFVMDGTTSVMEWVKDMFDVKKQQI